MHARRGMFALFLLISSGLTAAADEPYVTIPAGTTQTLVLQADGSYSARLGIIARDGGPEIGQLDFRKFEVQYKEGRADDLFGRFDVTPENHTDIQGDGLRITAKAAPEELLPGNYVVVVRVAPRTDGAKPQTLTFTLSRPAPSVSTGAAVHIERTEPLRGEARVVPGVVRLSEDSRAANLSGLAFSWDLDIKPDAPAASGKLILPSGPISLGAGRSQTYPVKLEGEFPPGKYTGKISVRSPQLASPVTLTFDLVSRRSPLWLIFIGLVGSMAGWIIRVYLKGKKETLDASIGASLAIQKLALAYNRIEEESVREQIAEQIATLNEKNATSKAADITAGAAAALTALQALETGFKADRTNFQSRIDDLEKQLAHDWILPPSLREGIEGVGAAHEKILVTFRRNNLTEAGRQIDNLIRGPLSSTAIAALDWRRQFASYLADLDSEHLPLAEEARRKLAAAEEAATAQLPKDFHPPAIALGDAVTELNATHGAFTGGQDFMVEIGNGMASFLTQSQRTLSSAGFAGSPVWAGIEQATRKLQETLRTSLQGRLNESAADVSSEMSALIKEWRSFFGSQISDKEAARAVSALLEARSWDETITRAAAVLDAQGQHESLDEFESTAQREPTEEMHGHDFGQLPRAATPHAGFGQAILTGSAAERRALLQSNRWIELLQTVVVGALFVGGLYLANADTWIGTCKDMLAIGVLAFGVDLTAEGVLGVLKK